MLTRRRNNKRGFTAVELVVVIVVLAIVVGVMMVVVDRERQARLREESAANLRILGTALIRDIWNTENISLVASVAPLSTSPGQLTPELTSVVTRLLLVFEHLSVFISPAHPDVERLRRDAVTNPESAITDDSYWYLGYVLRNEEAGLAFVDAYRKAVKKTGKPPTDNLKLTSLTLSAPDPRKQKKKGTYVLPLLKSLEYIGVDKARISSPNQYWDRSLLPVFIERPGLQRGGRNVLFLDGHVEFIPYPGKWPMTEKFIKALESLDELKGSNADAPKR